MMPASPASEVLYENLHVTRLERAFAQVRTVGLYPTFDHSAVPLERSHAEENVDLRG